ncbi:MAG: AbrB family transcriptional regulator [Phascolarctobacterium sp.]|nr:AbrB family transcriptional regulator [Phascolarctobacterium sp.]
MLLNRILLFVMALCLGHFLMRAHLPIPFLLGGLLSALAVKTCARRASVSWPKQLREYALMIAGYGIGSTFTADTWSNFMREIWGVTEATVVILGASLLLAFVTARVSGENLKSCIMGMLPGGMTLTMLLAEEDDEVNPNVVMVMQIIRLLSVVITVPFLVIWLLDAKVVGSSIALPNVGGVHWLVFIPLAVLGCFVAKKVHLPTPRLLGPILATAAFAVYSGGVQPVPVYLMAPAQVSIGLFMGMQLDADRIWKTRKMVPFILIGTALMIVVSIIMAHVLSERYGFSLITAFLAMAPGGIAEMSLAGMSMKENVSVILTYQLVRVLAINICIPPFLSWMFKKKTA